tara:strand:- start:379 stop:1050 length:672 start_codon:yes stop_codon:yes gene_type:complete
MTTNFFFNNFQSSMEQNLIEDLVVESIKIYGIDLYYLPKRIVARDTIFREEELATYNTAHPIEMYIKNVDGFEGEGDFMSKFGLEIRDRITFTVSRRSFASEVLTQEADMTRPLEGDLIWFPLTRKMYKIKFVEHEAIFYQLGSLQTYDMICELFEFNNETFETGIPDIDQVYAELDVDIGTAIASSVTLTDIQAQNEEFETVGQSGILDFSEMDPFSEGNDY